VQYLPDQFSLVRDRFKRVCRRRGSNPHDLAITGF